MKLSKYIDYSLLKANITENDIRKLCKGAIELEVHAVCINPCYVKLCKNLLRDSKIAVISVVGYPLGRTQQKQRYLRQKNALKTVQMK